MAFLQVALDQLRVNRANDRHGELANETAAIAELFRMREAHMKALAEDIVAEGAIYDPPLVGTNGDEYLIFDGNRRITCLKLIIAPEHAPNQELQAFFRGLHNRWNGDFPAQITCQIEDDRDVIDAILFRRHTGSQGGVGQSDWDDRAKRNFIERTGRGGKVDVADQIEALLTEEDQLPQRSIPRSTLNRLLSSEANRNRVGISIVGNRFALTHDRAAIMPVLQRIATDLSERQVVLGDLWDNDGKRAYLNRLEAAGLLPDQETRLPDGPAPRRQRRVVGGRPQNARRATAFIPHDAQHPAWRGNQMRARAIWDELTSLSLTTYPNAVSALLRIMLELSVDDYIRTQNLAENDNLAQKVRTVLNDILRRGLIDQNYFDEIDRMRQHNELISIRSMQRFVHSETFAPLPNELEVYWTRLGRFISICLND